MIALPVALRYRGVMKKHFGDEQWLYFVRGALAEGPRDLMLHHLESGCERCNKLCRTWRAVAELAGQVSQFEPAEAAIRIAKASFAPARRTYVVPVMAKMIPAVFDSFLDAGTAGIRGTDIQASVRHLLHQTGSWSVDLRVAAQNNDRMFIAGQVLRSRSGSAPITADVILMQGPALLDETSTNQFGEFQLQCSCGKNLCIYVDIAGRQPLGILLPDPES